MGTNFRRDYRSTTENFWHLFYAVRRSAIKCWSHLVIDRIPRLEILMAYTREVLPSPASLSEQKAESWIWLDIRNSRLWAATTGAFLCLTAQLENFSDLRIFLQGRQLLLDSNLLFLGWRHCLGFPSKGGATTHTMPVASCAKTLLKLSTKARYRHLFFDRLFKYRGGQQFRYLLSCVLAKISASDGEAPEE